MPRKLSKSQRSELQSIIVSKLQGNEAITDAEIARNIVPCSTRTIRNARSNILRHGSVDPPRKAMGRPREVTENMWLALQNQLEKYPCMSQQAMADFLFEQYQYKVSRFTIGRMLKRAGWTKKYLFGSVKNRIRKMSREDADLIRADFKSYLLMQIRVVGGDRKVARGHFRKAQIVADDL
ncbi:tpr domain-containing protein [Colletotrichum incanum]|uniref:Tpr domain-containing protein n=1 Tax=Colletotrichum incanum TaxID=1573173 RepID=A0A167ARZ2_COLIC|nr:tpr domain-containing protein [Colletotrichum incanum]